VTQIRTGPKTGYIPFAFDDNGANNPIISVRASGRKSRDRNHACTRRLINAWMLPAFRLSTRISRALSQRIAWMSSSILELTRILASSQLIDNSKRRGRSLARSISSISSSPSIIMKTGPAVLSSVVRSSTALFRSRFSSLTVVDRQRIACKSSLSDVSWNISE
jgi:hypothetical protein